MSNLDAPLAHDVWGTYSPFPDGKVCWNRRFARRAPKRGRPTAKNLPR